MTHRLHRIRRVLALSAAAAALAAAVHAAPADRRISLDAEDAYIPSVLKILAEKGDLNIITGPGVTSGKISIHMKDVPVDQAVNLVVRAAGLAYERIGNSVLVADARALKEETGLSSYIVELQYADANEVQAALKNLTDQITVDVGGNRLIVVTSPRIISEIQEIVSVLDRPVRQVMLEARIVEVSTDDLKRLGVDWDLLNRQTAVVVEGTLNTGADDKPATAAPDQLPKDLPFIPNTPGTQDLWKFRNMSRQAEAYQVALDLLIREGNARVLANPKVATLNGKEASLLIGRRIPFVISSTIFSGGGAAPTQRVEKEEVGIKLKITPLINADGFITTTVAPEVSSVVGFVGENADLPVISTRQATTTVRLKDGQTVIIGGLLSEETTTNVTKLPLLGDIPGLGLLFQHRSTSVAKRDLVIEVTPRILGENR